MNALKSAVDRCWEVCFDFCTYAAAIALYVLVFALPFFSMMLALLAAYSADQEKWRMCVWLTIGAIVFATASYFHFKWITNLRKK